MTSIVDTPRQYDRLSGVILVAAITLAALSEAIAGTILSLARGDIIGDTYATPDEFAWLDVGYASFKFMGFFAAPWLMTRFNPRNVLLVAILAMGMICGLAAITTVLDVLIGLRAIQGFSGGILLVIGQTLIFISFVRARQPILQAVFAMGSVVAPTTVAPALQGWLLDNQSWTWIFFSNVPVALAAAGLLMLADHPACAKRKFQPFDWVGFLLISVTLFSCTYVLSQGSRWDWYGSAHILWLSTLGVATLLAFLSQQSAMKVGGLIDFSLFQSSDFCFAFIVSFVAGAALFGSAFLIPSFAVSVLALTPTDAGLLLLPSGALLACALFIAASLIEMRRIPPVATVPFGILTIIVAMWMLSGSTSESGSDDMMPAVLVRGLGLGFLFLSITLIAFGNLHRRKIAIAICLFNAGRQVGGLIGVAGLQTLIDHQVASNLAVLGANLTTGGQAVSDRLMTTGAILLSKGMDTVTVGRAAISLLARTVTGQSTVIAFDSAFNAVALIFVFAAPLFFIIKIGLARHAKVSAKRLERIEEALT